jgi:hypothetical protein
MGYLLMMGESTTEQQFCPNVFSTRRIVIAPAICLSGYLLIIVGILKMKCPRQSNCSESHHENGL